uniref:NADH-ubiquinone oxidoreductase chain 6 n=1 Tax=Formicosepsis sp. LX2018-01 TaxID=2697604 RepID=A0A6G6A4L9_9MUSC|nr:NADH dehydrogenase subunit 6 [Formicosepsis sp. LX2018-01]
MLMTISSFIFLKMKHPLAMGLMLLIQTLLICLTTGMMAQSYWFSYILFLIFIGGMLVLFIYMTSLASNEMFSFSNKMMITIMISFSIIMMMLLFVDKMNWSNWLMNNNMQSLSNLNSFISENSLNLNKLYNYPTNLLTIILMNYLLITLIAVVKITKLFYGPLRQMH